jgi:hypothetical protein
LSKDILDLLEIILKRQQTSYNILRKPPFLVVNSYVVGNGFKVQRKEGSKVAKYTKCD